MERQAQFSITSVLEQCLLEIESQPERKVSDDQLLKLNMLLGRTWSKVLQVVDQNGVHCYEASGSKRRLFQVAGKSHHYITLPKRFCSCEAFYHEVVLRGDAPFCKHQLAARLAVALNCCPTTSVSEAELAQFLLQA